jgi:peroxiredoxin
MVATETPVGDFGWKAPDFDLPGVDGKRHRLSDLRGENGTLVMFICNHCPYVKHVRRELARLGNDYSNSGLGIVAISSNDIDAYPADSPEAMKTEAETFGYSFPYLYDETQVVAAAYTAMCTPDFFLFGAENKLAYRGRLDESRPDSGIPVTGKELRAAVDAVLAGDSPSDQQVPSMGCSIKWKSGSTPAYFTS